MNNKGNDNLNAIRILGVTAINKANSGHPGIVLGATPMIYSLYANVMNVDPKDPIWFNRDRFILSAGHGSAMLYSMLHLAGYDFSMDDLKNFRQLGSRTPGHPERNPQRGIEVTTGPLGQGIGMAVGEALAESFLAARFNKPDAKVIDHYTYVICGDGDLEEGVSYETISFAGRNKLNKLIVLHDSNDVQLDDYVASAFNENMSERFQSAGWNTLKVTDGEDIEAITKAIEQAKQSDKPTYIEVKTIIGRGAKKLEGGLNVHGAPIGAEALVGVKEEFGWNYDDFEIPQSVYDFYKNTTQKRGSEAHQAWNDLMDKYAKEYPDDYETLMSAINEDWDVNWDEIKQSVWPYKKEATRDGAGKIFKSLSEKLPTIIGGSADLTSSTRIGGADGKFGPDNRTGREIMYGVREFGMGAINNGLACHGGLLPIASGFFVFTDYMKAALRMSAMMKAKQLYVFSHDSIGVGEDGPTHQPIEQLAMIRSIPGQTLFRPADDAETFAAFNWAVNNMDGPVVICTTRQGLDQLEHKEDIIEAVGHGAYVIDDEKDPQITLIATGSEVSLAIEAKKLLQAKNYKVRVVSIPSWEIFDAQSKDYQDSVIDRDTFRVSIEMGSTFGWAKYTGDDGLNIGIDEFGKSAPGELVQESFGFTPDKIAERIIKAYKD